MILLETYSLLKVKGSHFHYLLILETQSLTQIQNEVMIGIVLLRWSLLPNALQPSNIYCAPPIIITQLVLFLWQTVKIDPLGHVSC